MYVSDTLNAEASRRILACVVFSSCVLCVCCVSGVAFVCLFMCVACSLLASGLLLCGCWRVVYFVLGVLFTCCFPCGGCVFAFVFCMYFAFAVLCLLSILLLVFAFCSIFDCFVLAF